MNWVRNVHFNADFYAGDLYTENFNLVSSREKDLLFLCSRQVNCSININAFCPLSDIAIALMLELSAPHSQIP